MVVVVVLPRELELKLVPLVREPWGTGMLRLGLRRVGSRRVGSHRGSTRALRTGSSDKEQAAAGAGVAGSWIYVFGL